LRITTIAVIGAVTVGPAFARAAAVAGYATVLEDMSREMLERGVRWIRESLRGDVARGVVAQDLAGAALRRIATAGTVEDAIRDADLIVEAVPEELEMKLELFTVFDKFAKPGAIFASTTETLSILEISDVTICRERCVGMRLRGEGMEMVRTRLTSEETVRRCEDVARRMAGEFRWVADIAGV
jgi:3-hydroxyacyl-CoA dehydrogenase